MEEGEERLGGRVSGLGGMLRERVVCFLGIKTEVVVWWELKVSLKC